MRQALAGLVLLTCASVGAFAAPNYMPNSGFEQGDAGWQLWREDPPSSRGGVTEEVAREGLRCFKVETEAGKAANLHSDPVPALAETDYTLSVYARTRSAQKVRVALWALGPHGETLSYDLPHGVDVPADQPAWARFTCVVRTPANCVALKAHLICGGGTVWWDGAQLEWGRWRGRYRSGPPFGTDERPVRNLLFNSGFEQGPAEWALWHQFPGTSSGEVAEGAGRDGGRAYHVVNPGEGGANLHSKPVPCVPGALYTLSVYARVKAGNDMQVAGWGLDGRGQVVSYALDGLTELPGDVPAYRRFSKTFRAPPNCVMLKAHLICNGGEVWWDDCQLEAAPDATAYEPGPRVELLPLRRLPEAVEYTRAIIREARLRDVFAQSRRLLAYAGEPGREEPGRRLAEAADAVERIGRILEAPHLVPDYAAADYGRLREEAGRAEALLREVSEALGHDSDGAFAEWRPPALPPNMPKRELAEEFLIFPCFTSSLFFEGDGDWRLLEPFAFRLVSGWWSPELTPEGELVTGALDGVIRTCLEHGYVCDIAVDGADGAAAALKGRLGEEAFLHNAKGEWSPQGDCHNTVNIWQPEMRAVAADFLRRVCARYAEEPGVVSYELTNEPALTIERHEHGYQYTRLGPGGYSQAARAAWTDWLRRRYRTAEELNARWRTDYADLEHVPPPADLSPPEPRDDRTPVPCGAVHDFQAFRAESHAEWFATCVNAMHEQDPRKAVISQFVSGPIERNDAAVDLRRMAEAVPWDFYGTHDWPGGGPATSSLYAVSMNRRAGLPHWEDEFIWSQWSPKGTPEPVMRAVVERNLWRQVAWGKRGISLFNLETEWGHDSPWNWNNSLINIAADYEVPRYSTGVIPTVERKVNLFKDILFDTLLDAPDVCLLRATTATLVSAPDGRPREEATALADYLLAQHHMPLLVPEEHLLAEGDSGDWRLLIVPWAVNVPDGLQERLVALMQEGRSVFATGPFGLFDGYGRPDGRLMRRLVGDLRWRYADGRWHTSLEGLKADVRRVPVGEGAPPVLVAPCGEGSFYLWPDSVHVMGNMRVLEAVMKEAVGLPYVQTDLAGISVVPRVGADGAKYLFVINLDADSAKEGVVEVRGRFEHVVDLTCECRPEVPASYGDGTTALPLVLHPGGAVFLSLGQDLGGGATAGGDAAAARAGAAHQPGG